MPRNVDKLLKIFFLLCKTQFQNRQFNGLTQIRSRWLNNFQKMLLSYSLPKTIHSRLSNERNFYLQIVTSWLQLNTFKRNKKTYSKFWWEKTVLTKFNLARWRKYFRMSHTNFTNLVNALKPKLIPYNLGSKISPEKQVAITLFFLGSGKNYQIISKLFDLKIHDIASCIRIVCKTILHCLLQQYIKLPSDIEIISYLDNFEKKWGVPHCAGILDCLHIPLNGKKLSEHSTYYLNSDGGYSMYLQGVIDPTYKFWDINVGWPGSVSESKVFTSSALWRKGQEGKLFPDWTRDINGVNVPIFILGNSSYPLTNWVLKPIQDDDNLPEDDFQFNQKFTFARSISEIAFKRLKARWNCLVSGNTFNIDEFPAIITVCCILHNFCETMKEPINDEWIVRSERLYQQPLPSSCNTICGSDAKNILYALKKHFSK